MSICLFFFNDTATTEIYTLSLHDALPISALEDDIREYVASNVYYPKRYKVRPRVYFIIIKTTAETMADFKQKKALHPIRSEEHTSELQSRQYLVCRLLLEKKKNKI